MKKKVVKFLIIVAILIGISVIIVKIVSKDDKIVVCIDAGHGGTDVGAVFDNRYEKDDTLAVSQLVKKYLEENDIKVIMTRDKDKTVELKQRCRIANKNKADLFVSIHRNSAKKGNGIEIWANNKKNNKDLELATKIQNHLQNTKIQNDRGVKFGTVKGEDTNYYVLQYTNMPSCLIELGFITDKQDNQLFDSNINEYASAIAEGIIENIKRKD